MTTQSPWAMHFCFPHSAHTGSLWTWGFFRWNVQNYKTHTPTEVAEGSVLLPPFALVALHCEVARPVWDLIGDHLLEMVKVILPYATCQCEVHAVQQFLSLTSLLFSLSDCSTWYSGTFQQCWDDPSSPPSDLFLSVGLSFCRAFSADQSSFLASLIFCKYKISSTNISLPTNDLDTMLIPLLCYEIYGLFFKCNFKC